MLAGYPVGERRSSTLSKILRLLEALKQTQTGRVLYRHVEQMLDDYDANRIEVEQSYACLIGLLLDAYTTHLDADTAVLAQVKMLQARLTPPLSAAELSVLHGYIQTLADYITQTDDLPAEAIESALRPLLVEFGFDAESDRRSRGDRRAARDRRSNVHYLQNGGANVERAPREPDVEHTPSGELPYGALSDDIAGLIDRCETLASVLNQQLAVLRDVSTIEEFSLCKADLLGSFDAILNDHSRLLQEFRQAREYLTNCERDSDRLNAELNRAVVLSLTDELTGLSNRRAFMQRLDDEISRAQRYGHALSLALIDIDRFKSVNDAYGHPAGDMVLREYAQVLSSFRHHDLVARYGGEEFAVILPNTTAEGALRALQKAQHRAANTTLKGESFPIPLPTFSAGLAIYQKGEPLQVLIKRADEALYRAKGLGRSRIELAKGESAVG